MVHAGEAEVRKRKEKRKETYPAALKHSLHKNLSALRLKPSVKCEASIYSASSPKFDQQSCGIFEPQRPPRPGSGLGGPHPLHQEGCEWLPRTHKAWALVRPHIVPPQLRANHKVSLVPASRSGLHLVALYSGKPRTARQPTATYLLEKDVSREETRAARLLLLCFSVPACLLIAVTATERAEATKGVSTAFWNKIMFFCPFWVERRLASAVFSAMWLLAA